jgi:hypothetical protein
MAVRYIYDPRNPTQPAKLTLLKCQVCGGRKRLQIHHLDGNPRNQRLANLRVVCAECHLERKEAHHDRAFGTRKLPVP